ncbi:hypothetical protein N7493_005209 [Penicillium malachiteum]|uniref:Bud22 domain-containing protein n=1 Tax=Penicillium malachiteum TaxID=1324776 RepID=A0AAD6HM74_9EURO|nr:hypothetical protein N7493_005209 [Penicillium malachiteum]
MPKRKLSEFTGPQRTGNAKNRKLSMKAVRLTNKFDLSVQILIKGLKTARGFERQKLSRREKAARTPYDSVTLGRLGEEVDALKKLDYQVTAERYLFKQLSKTKRIAESPIFKEFQEEKNVSIEGPKSTAESNILARLFKSTPVKNVLPTMLAEIRTLLGIEDIPAGKQDKTSAKKDGSKKEKAEKPVRQKKEVSVSGSESEGEEVQGEEMDVSGDESGDEDFSQFDSRLAPDSDAEESDDEDDEENDGRAFDDVSDSVSSLPSPEFSGEESESSPPPKKTKASKASSAPAQSTTFLPSLMMGGYWSGSESEATDVEETVAPPKRKNRMGQQARRALWEKKYGDKANHVQAEQLSQKYNRDNGWDTKRGATGGPGRDKRGARGGDSGRPLNRAERRRAGIPSTGQHKQPPKDEGPLHPSWEAKKKLKEQATATFSGKKVTFD